MADQDNNYQNMRDFGRALSDSGYACEQAADKLEPLWRQHQLRESIRLRG